LYSFPNTIRQMKPRRWHAWERRGKCRRFWWESLKERDHSEHRGVDGRMGSEWLLGRLAGGGGGAGTYTGSSWLRIGTGSRLL
jgi:hypothetical protein